jgi:hypothetical protein
MVAAGPSGDIDILPDFHEAICAEDCEAAVTPRRQTVWREPVYSDVAGPAVAAQGDVAEVFERGVLRMVHVADLRRDDLGAGRAGEIQKLVGLV